METESRKWPPTYPYHTASERYMKMFYNNLNEKDNKRHYAALEAQKLPYGGINYIAELLGCARSTIYAGLKELKKTTF